MLIITNILHFVSTVKTGIRSSLYNGWMKYLEPILEGLVGLLTTSSAGYAEKITPVLFAKGLEEHNGSMFNPSGQPVMKSTFLDDELTTKFIDNSKKLVEDKAGVSLGVEKTG